MWWNINYDNNLKHLFRNGTKKKIKIMIKRRKQVKSKRRRKNSSPALSKNKKEKNIEAIEPTNGNVEQEEEKQFTEGCKFHPIMLLMIVKITH